MRTLFAASLTGSSLTRTQPTPARALGRAIVLTIGLAIVLTVVLAAGPAAARCIPFIPGEMTSPGGRVLLLPDGSGPSLEDLGATIVVQLWRCPGEPYGLVGLPAQDVWLDSSDTGTLAFCAPGAIADGPTDEQGITTFSRALAGGGVSWEELRLHAGGVIFRIDNLQFVSPDFDGDLDVDLADVAIFAADFRSGDPTGTGARSDFDFDGRLDLRDFGILAMALGSECP